MEAKSAYTVELSFVDRKSGAAILGEPVRLQPGTPVPAVGDSVCLTERDTDYSQWVVMSREFMYLTSEVGLSVRNLQVTFYCDRQA